MPTFIEAQSPVAAAFHRLESIARGDQESKDLQMNVSSEHARGVARAAGGACHRRLVFGAPQRRDDGEAGGADSHPAAFNAGIARFEELYPSIEIKATYPPGTLATTSRTARRRSRADISSSARAAPGRGLPSLWALGPRYLDLTARPWAKQLWSRCRRSRASPGRSTAYRSARLIQFVVYNRDLFAQLG